jgi:uncharacterized protein involved in copper resistance
LALYNFEAQATAYLGEGGQTAARLEGDYDILLTNKLINRRQNSISMAKTIPNVEWVRGYLRVRWSSATL